MSAKDPFGLVGTTIDGKYALERVVGEGGFGVVYAGTHLVLKQPVALKVLKPQGGTVAEQAQLTDAFLREARVLFTLSHRAIVRFYEVGTILVGVNTVPYVVLELLDGHTLEDEIRRRASARGPHFTREEIARILDPVLEALALAHEAGVVHRDLKPGNIMLTPGPSGPTPKVLDFGTARAGSLHASTTKVAFTPRYAAPEQWDETYGPPGPWTDVYALGAIFFEMCNLAVALPGDGVGQIMRASMTFRDRIDLGRTRPDLPAAFGPVLARAVAAPPAERFSTATAMRAAFTEAVRAPAPVALAPPPMTSFAPPGGTTGPHTGPRPTYGPPGAAATGPYTAPLIANGQRPANHTPYFIGASALLIGIMALISWQSLASCAGDSAPPPVAPTTRSTPSAPSGAWVFSVPVMSNPALRSQVRERELAPCLARETSHRVQLVLTIRRENEQTHVTCAPDGRTCACARDIVEQWSVTGMSEAQSVSFSVLATR